MKYIVILIDGAADEPISSLGGKTILQAAKKPNIDELCRRGATGMLKTVPDNLHPGSEVANMAIMGYDVANLYQGRGVLEAASIGIDFDDTDLVMRCNLVSVENNILLNHSGGHITTEDAGVLIDLLNEKLSSERVRFYKGVSYRHILIVKNGINDLILTPPHDVPGKNIYDVYPKSEKPNETRDLLEDLMRRSQAILEAHPINIERKKMDKPMANHIWPWSAGYKPKMPKLSELYPKIKRGAVISAVDLIHGIGHLGGMDSIYVEGTTGLYNTNFTGKAQAAIEALKTYDYVYLHMEAPDEAGHEGNIQLKKQVIEDIDTKVVGPIMKAVDAMNEDVCIALLPDHPTPCERIKTHTRADIPFILYKKGISPDNVTSYDEFSAKNGNLGRLIGTELMDLMMKF